MIEKTPRILAAASVVAVALAAFTGIGQEKPAGIEFTDKKKQTEEFIRYYETIKLTAEQENIKRKALVPLPAPCCSDNTAYTCCCPCNLSKSIWGLSAVLITEHGYGAEEVQEAVKEWMKFIAPAGFSGNVCYNRGCGRPFDQNGCGGMNASHIVW